ncbi:MAG: hypothetical protein P1U68_18055 [Verrucomicrobiales bacterium]|nr:hypothetical protein [Verrucomicrobiales bacterium]
MTGKDKAAALAAIRDQLGGRIRSGSDLLRVQETQQFQAATGLDGLNQHLGGGLPKGQLTEIISEAGSCGGGGLVMAAMLSRARREQQYVMLFDVGGSFTVESFPPVDLEALLWVGCSSPRESLEALDVASRDENFGLFLLDWRNCTASDWRGLRSSLWYRILGQLRERGTPAVLFAPESVTSVAKRKLEVSIPVTCRGLDEERELLWKKMAFETFRPAVKQGQRVPGISGMGAA